MNGIGWAAVCLLALLVGCGEEAPPAGSTAPQPGIPGAGAPPGKMDHDEEPPPPPPSGRPVVAFRDGRAVEMTEPQAVAQGLTVVDLSNYWVPFIFSEKDGEEGERLKNEFRPIFRKLANDWHYESRTMAAAREVVDKRRDRARAAKVQELRERGVTEEEINELLGLTDDGTDGGAGKTRDAGDLDAFAGGLGEAKNYLEVYGIPPSLSVLRRRAMQELDLDCYKEIDFEAIRRFDGFIAYKSKAVAQAESRKGRTFHRKMRREMERVGVDDPLALSDHPDAKASRGMISAGVQYEALAEAQKLLFCEGFFEEDKPNYWAGGLDWKTHQALLAFEHKNRIFGWGFFGKDTLTALGKKPSERLFDAFVRVLTERVIDAAHIIEDGSARDEKGQSPTYKDRDGEEHPVRNLVAEFTAAALRHMDLRTPEKMLDFLKSPDDDEFDRLFVALPMPEKPPYYGDEMELSAQIDRGDVWYDYPYAEDGRHKVFPRKRMPKLTLFVTWNGQTIPLVTMNTTIGGWRSELAPDGYQYFKYKNSDVGQRVWRDVVAGPVWLPPDSTPTDDLVKEVIYRGRKVKVPNYDEFGPWYASAYGLVAAFHVRPVERKSGRIDYFDNGIRSHGSVDYNSILRRFSHGCHRLYNHLAIRLFDFVLRHRPYTRVGQVQAGYSHKFTVEDEETEEEETYTLELDSKGYKYELIEPVPVNVLKGRIRGKQKVPIETYMPKPGVEYKDDAELLPEEFRKKPSGDAGTDTAQTGGSGSSQETSEKASDSAKTTAIKSPDTSKAAAPDTPDTPATR